MCIPVTAEYGACALQALVDVSGLYNDSMDFKAGPAGKMQIRILQIAPGAVNFSKNHLS